MPTKEHTMDNMLNGRTVQVLESGEHFDREHLSFPLPSGTGTFTIRRMKGKDQNKMLSDNKRELMQPFFNILASCLHQEPNFKTMTQNDFMFQLFILRRLTFGDYFTFTSKCPSCTKQVDWEEDLSTTQTIFASPEVAETIAREGDFEYIMPLSGKKIRFRLPVAGDYQKLKMKYANNRERFKTEAVRLCLTAIEKDDGTIQPYVTEKNVEELESFDIQSLEQYMDSLSFGVVTTIEIECDNCTTTYQTEMPLSGKDFLLAPSSVKARETKNPDGSLRLSTLYPFQTLKTSGSKSSDFVSSKTDMEPTSPTQT